MACQSRTAGGARSLVDGKATGRQRRYACILLLADEGREGGDRTDADIAAILEVGMSKVKRVRCRCVIEGLELEEELGLSDSDMETLRRACFRPVEIERKTG